MVNPLDDAQWDAKLTASFPAASPFFLAGWARVLNSTYGYTPQYLAKESSGGFGFVLPLMEVRSWLTGTRGVCLPFTDTCEALVAESAGPVRLHEELFTLGRTRNWDYFELRGPPPLDRNSSPSVSFFGHQLRLPSDPAALFPLFDSAVRRAVRKAENEGVTVALESSLESVHTFYRLLCKTRSRHGLPPQPWRFFANVHRHVIGPGNGLVAIARMGQIPVAGAVFFHCNAGALYKFAASDDAFQHLRGNNLVLWRSIEHYARQGCSFLDFGRTSLTNEGLRRFKLSWHAEERPIDYFRYNVKTGAVIPTPDKAVEGLHTRVFRSMPAPLTRLFGNVAYKHLG